MMALLCRKTEVINLAMIWNSFTFCITLFSSKNILSNAYSVGNLSSIVDCCQTKKDSSETIRKTSFQFHHFYRTYSRFYLNQDTSHKIDPDWLVWFIGFSEGDGSIITSINAKRKRIRFVITQKEKQILCHIQQTLGFGTVRYSINGNYYRYIVENNKDIYILATLFNRNLVLPYRNFQLYKWIETLNKSIFNTTSSLTMRYKLTVQDIIQATTITQLPTLNDSWISGFTDAEGNFSCLIKKPTIKHPKYKCSIRFILDQNDAEKLFFYISSLFTGGSVYHRKNTNNVFRIEIRSIKSIKIIYHYFTHYKLKTKKQYSFQKWCVIYNILLGKEHLTTKGIEEILLLSKQININYVKE